jgi:hypothetical protein
VSVPSPTTVLIDGLRSDDLCLCTVLIVGINRCCIDPVGIYCGRPGHEEGPAIGIASSLSLGLHLEFLDIKRIIKFSHYLKLMR